MKYIFSPSPLLTDEERRDKPSLEATVTEHARKYCCKTFHGDHPADNPLVISEEKPTKGGELYLGKHPPVAVDDREKGESYQ